MSLHGIVNMHNPDDLVPSLLHVSDAKLSYMPTSLLQLFDAPYPELVQGTILRALHCGCVFYIVQTAIPSCCIPPPPPPGPSVVKNLPYVQAKAQCIITQWQPSLCRGAAVQAWQRLPGAKPGGARPTPPTIQSRQARPQPPRPPRSGPSCPRCPV